MDYETLQQETEEIEKNLSHTKEELEQAKADKEKSRSEYDSVESAIAEFDRSVEKKKEKVNQDKLLITNFEGEIRITKEKFRLPHREKNITKSVRMHWRNPNRQQMRNWLLIPLPRKRHF